MAPCFQGQTPLTQAPCPGYPHSHPSLRAPAQQPIDGPHLCAGRAAPERNLGPHNTLLARGHPARRGHSNRAAAVIWGPLLCCRLGSQPARATSWICYLQIKRPWPSPTLTLSLCFLIHPTLRSNDQDDGGMVSPQPAGRHLIGEVRPSASEWQLGPDPCRLLRAKPTSQKRRKPPLQWEAWTHRGRVGCAISCARPKAHKETTLSQHHKDYNPKGRAQPKARLGGCPGGHVRRTDGMQSDSGRK